MKFYNPGYSNIHQVKVTLMFEDYKGAIIYEVGGNTMGSSILKTAISSVADGDFIPVEHELNKKHINSVDEAGYIQEVVLFNGKKRVLIDIGDVEDSIVSAEIISYKIEK
ncbi:hypothetical protein G7L40_20570 [Paenibacillus polymyxa]|uniref:Uncharacterized protein n=1 Tax=Paenibacillus polymyxa TaxID=1406 RepID=A0A378XYW9_PAEPO|nr:hypothetical protein [Paenibacillus polymyxa]MBE7896115.1 hypothetical protein [Paenibacillus polymyxa]MBG9765939.1 hypothetical protein [Paenibacillus polymyxa]MCC3256645.1 hypothetical protein [Paenibacillus polymyxa]QPK54864.1 hypothetical protein G7035_20615 [Paenibacillus polymyxa]QPK59954.1 hypothetical protein G7L40_20570 [Paenibacillus polymyxa]